MRRRHTLLGLAAPLALVWSARAGTDGPSAAGLVYTDSAEPGGPSHVWLDASDGTPIALGAGGTAPIALPFTFTFGGVAYTSATVAANGVLAFDPGSADWSAAAGPCPDTADYRGIAAFQDDLGAETVYTRTFGRYPDRTFVIAWPDARPAGAPDGGRFAIYLLEGRDEAIIALDDVDFGDAAHDGGASAVIGAAASGAGLAWSCAGGRSSGSSAWFGPATGRPGRPEVRSDELPEPTHGDANFAYAGSAVSAGDVDGNGVDDALTGARDRRYGQAYLTLRPGGGGVFTDADAVFSGKASGDSFGAAVLLADLDGDGYADVGVGAPGNDGAGANAGRVYLWAGADVGATPGEYAASTANVTVSGDASDRPGAGASLYGGPDIDGDGYADLLVGAPDSDVGASNAGAAYLYRGPLTSGAVSPDAILAGGQASERLGTAVSAADLDADGAAEILLGAPYNDAGATDAGAVYVLAGGGWSGTVDVASDAACTWTHDAATDHFGATLLAADLDGSGWPELVAGAPGANRVATDAGAVFGLVDPGPAGCAGTTGRAAFTLTGAGASHALGGAMTAGDLDGDGVSDLIVAAANATTDTSGAGAVYIATSLPSGVVSASDADLAVLGEATGGAFGTGLALAQDDDAWPTLLVTAPYASVVYTADGALYAYGYAPDFPDDDGDGFVDRAAGGNDCDDGDAAAYPGGYDAPDDGVDGDCDGWIDGVLVARTDADAFAWDLTDIGAPDGGHVFDFETYAEGDPVSAYTVDGTTLTCAPALVAAASVSGARAAGTRAGSFTPVSTTALTLDFSTPVDAIALDLLDGDDTFRLTATGTDGTLAYVFEESADNRTGGVFHGFTFAFPVDTLVLQAAGGDAFGVDDLKVTYADETDHDLDGWVETDGDCDDTRADVNPDAEEQLGDERDNDCDGVVDAGEATLWTDRASFLAAAHVVVPQTVDFERLAVSEAAEAQYVDVGVQFLPTADGAATVDATPAHDAVAIAQTGGTLTLYFKEPQPAVGFALLGADATVTAYAYSHGVLAYTTALAAASPDAFYGFDYAYTIDELRLVASSGSDTFGIDDLVYSGLGLDDADGDGQTESEGDCDDADADTYTGADEVWYDGVDQDCSDAGAADPASDYDADGDGALAEAYGGTDCDDGDASVNPDATEIWYDGIDSDCDGANDYDADGDGHVGLDWGGDDCDETDAAVSPDAPEDYYDGLDSDCDPADEYDADGDGYTSAAFGGTDCDDAAAATNPDAPEVPYDGIDEDCSGSTPAEDYDADGDGYTAATYGGVDCADHDPAAYPHAPGETCYDGVDQDCDGASDYDCDSDGYDSADWGGTDCDDADAGIHPGAADARFDGIDANCDGGPEYDYDGDGHDAIADGGDDCDDDDPAVFPGAVDDCYDGVDADCDGGDDDDCDRDGDRDAAHGGGDCADDDPEISSLAEDFPYDGVDRDCDGAPEFDVDGDGHDAAWYGGDDCDDADASVFPGAVDPCYDGVDQDCSDEGPAADRYADDDCDHDGHPLADDCDDADPAVFPGAPDAAGDGLDADCDGADACTDCDGDGHDAIASGGDDCDDTRDDVHPGAAEVWYDGVDEACDGGDDYDRDGDGADASAWGGGDCNDANAAVSPLIPADGCGHGDEDCDRAVDEDCTEPVDTGAPVDTGGAADTADTAPDSGADSGADTSDWTPSDTAEAPYLTYTTLQPCGCASAPDAGGWALALMGAMALRRRR